VLLRPGQKQDFVIRTIDENGMPIEQVTEVKWESFVPQTARVQARMDAHFNEEGELVAEGDAKISAGSFLATYQDGITGTIREGFCLISPMKRISTILTYPLRMKWSRE
jgi:outer membrane protein assembly factor BamB